MSCLLNFIEKHVNNNYLTQRVNNLKKLHYNEQKSDGWLNDRYGYITGSDIGSALGINHFKSQDDFIKEKILKENNFKGNKATDHGSKYEDVAILLIEFLDRLKFKNMFIVICYNYIPDRNLIDLIIKYIDLDFYSKIYEFGLIPNYIDRFIGASPDGIRLDGRMKEIKCPFTRQISNYIPNYYMAQMQIQMQCANLYECDFFQATITEYVNEQDYIDDSDEKNDYMRKNNLYKGCIIELKKKDKLSYKYPKKLDITYKSLKAWITKNKKLKSFHKVIYWKLDKYTNVLVKRDDKWYDDNKPILQEVWNKVLQKDLKELITYSDGDPFLESDDDKIIFLEDSD